jgi:hypothetical protein
VSTEIDITINAYDKASATISEMGTKITGSLNSVSDAGAKLASSQKDVKKTTDDSSVSAKDSALAMNNLATAGLGLYMAVDRVQQSNIGLDKANLTLDKSQRDLTLSEQAADKAGRDLADAQDAAKAAVEKYGAGSDQAEKAQQKLSDAQQTYKNALDKLPIAQDQVTLAQERQKQAQENVNTTMMSSALMVIPTAITAISSISTAASGFGSVLTFLAANPIVLVIGALVAIGIAIYELYEHWKPFHNAVDALGKLLGGAFKTAWDALSSAFSWAYNYVFKPVFDAFEIFYNSVLKPIGDFFGSIGNALGLGGSSGSSGGSSLAQIQKDAAIANAQNDVNIAETAVQTAIKSNSTTQLAAAKQHLVEMQSKLAKAKAMAEGGIVEGPTLALIGESGPEAVIPLSNRSRMSNIAGLNGLMSQSFDIDINIQGSVDQQTLAVMRQELKNVVIEATSSNAPANMKSIRRGSLF